MKKLFRALIVDESGQDLAEYGIALAVIAVAVVTASFTIATNVQTLWTTAQVEVEQVAAQVGN